MKKKNFLVSQVFSFRHTKQNSKNVVDATFKKPFDRTVHETKLISFIAYNFLSVWKLLSAATCRNFEAGFYRGIVFAFFSKVELFDFAVDGGNLVRAWLGGIKIGESSKVEGGIKSSGCPV